MRTLFLLICLIPVALFAQVGVKGGWTTKNGYHAGVVFAVPFKKEKLSYFQVEALFNTRTDKEYYFVTDERGTSRREISIDVKHSYFMVPLTVKAEFDLKPAYPFFILGAAPSLGVSQNATGTDIIGLFGLGIRVKRFVLDGRYAYGFKDVRIEKNSKTFMVSLAYFITKN